MKWLLTSCLCGLRCAALSHTYEEQAVAAILTEDHSLFLINRKERLDS